ncbi:MAG: hypothetical protein G01um101425_592 [Candidatus Peregrinibacteria bacterium Gr01-1014_25]|nr:MAG: hypothetical protein G01um101425_592 [Candidatus Peregrinibacteria bacterium Gr01-1014_25]
MSLREDFILGPDANSAIERSSDLAKRILEQSTLGFAGQYGHISVREAFAELSAMKQKGYFAPDVLPKTVENFRKVLDALLKGKKHVWKVSRSDGSTEEVPLNQDGFRDTLLVGGAIASDLLPPAKLWKGTAHGFRSDTDMAAVTGVALMHEAEREDLIGHRGFSWESEDKGRTYRTEIGGDMNADLRIYRTDLTFDPTIDPFGNAVSYRPTTSRDAKIIAAYHSQEPTLLAALLKWAHHEQIESPLLANSAKEFLEEMSTWDSRLANAADAGYGDVRPNMHFIGFDRPLSRPGGKETAILPREYHKVYLMHTDSEGNFAISNPEADEQTAPEDPHMVFPKAEFDTVLRGLFMQTRMGLGRTSLRQLRSVLEYYFSPKFTADREREKSWARKQAPAE